MANTIIDTNVLPDINDVPSASTGSAPTNEIRVIIKEGVTKEEAYITLRTYADALMRGDLSITF